MVLENPVDFLVCAESGRSRRLDVHLERGNSLCRLNAHRRESGLMHQRESKLVHYVHRSHSYFAKLIIDATRLRFSSFSLLISGVLNWSVAHLFDSLDRPNRLRELNT